MLKSWLERQLVPLRDSVADFEVRRIQARERALELSLTASRAAVTPIPAASLPLHGCEIPVSSPDGLVRGRIDAVVLADGEPVIRDYKSGAIFEPRTDQVHALKEIYEIQLRMYAALYASTGGRWPATLEVVPVLGAAQRVDFEEDECEALVRRARDALENVNHAVAQAGSPAELQEALAHPRPQTCAHCPYRPACGPYRVAAQAGPPWPNDVWGRVESISQLGGDRRLMTVRSGDQLIRVRGLTAGSRHPALGLLGPGDPVAAFNLRATGSPSMFTESAFTVIYKLPDQAGAGSAEAPAS